MMQSNDFQKALFVSDENMARFQEYLRILEKWQKKINLVSANSLPDVWRRHVLDSAQLLSHIPKETQNIVDIGSGAGFPGIVLAIIGQFTVHLVESDARKCAFLNEVNRSVQAGAQIHNCRIEELKSLKTNVITARACAPLTKLLDFAYPLLNSNGMCLFLKGRKVDEELTEAKKKWKMDTQHISSKSDPSGIILKLEDISHYHG